jgi:lysophospholipase L1-like esterase
MRKQLTLLALSCLALTSARAQAPLRSILADFGPNDVTNGNITPSPDANGNYWNNILNNTAVTDTFRLVDKTNVATGIKLKVGANFLTNGIATGGLLAPSAALLGEYAIATATQDYFFVQGTGATSVGVLTMKGFDPTKRYVFHMFGSRVAATETRITQYRLTGATSSTVLHTTTGPNVGANGYAGNNNTIATSDTLAADASGIITLELSKNTGQYAYLNLMRIDEVPGRSTPSINYSFQNPGFELGNFTFWTAVPLAPGSANVISTSIKRNGSYAAQLSGGSLRLEQQIGFRAITGTTDYEVSGYFYHAAPAALSGTQAVYMELSCYDAANNFLGRFKSDSLVASSPANAWTRLTAHGVVPAGTAFVKGAAVWHNAAGATGQVYFDDLAFGAYVAPVPVNPYKLTIIGSSVPFGIGATNNRGYTTLFSELLTRRNLAGRGGPWVTANVAVPGNNTTDVLGRFEADVLPQHGKYVLIGLALGNEGILTGGQPIFNQFRDNLIRIVQLARNNGLVPIVAGGYTRNDYSATQYTFTRQMNLLIHGWNLPSLNLLGAVDDGNGRWADGYWWDALHPNDIGHAEMSYAIVPSLLDALNANKPQPTRRATNGLTLSKRQGQATDIIRLVPEELVHPFTTSVRFRASTAGQLVQVLDSAGLSAGTVSIDASGVVKYSSAKGQTITGSVNVTDNRWHQLVLTHYYARGATQLYVDSVREGNVAERLRPTRFDFGGAAAPTRVQLRNLYFYRSGMNQDEVWAMAADSLLKGSLEIYAPLNGGLADSLSNFAQSTNTLSRVAGPLAVRESLRATQTSLYPNPTTGMVAVQGPLGLEGAPVEVRDLLGRAVLRTHLRQGQLDLSALPAGVYMLTLKADGETLHRRVERL